MHKYTSFRQHLQQNTPPSLPMSVGAHGQGEFRSGARFSKNLMMNLPKTYGKV